MLLRIGDKVRIYNTADKVLDGVIGTITSIEAYYPEISFYNIELISPVSNQLVNITLSDACITLH